MLATNYFKYLFYAAKYTPRKPEVRSDESDDDDEDEDEEDEDDDDPDQESVAGVINFALKLCRFDRGWLSVWIGDHSYHTYWLEADEAPPLRRRRTESSRDPRCSLQ